MDVIVFLLEEIIGGVILVLAYLVVWAILAPCALIIATPLVLVLALIRSGGFGENSKRYYGAILRHLLGMLEWIRTRRTERSSRSS